ncbi:GNAT family N-acetyltransferase [Actinomyces qiguomingii]|uniref:GNAT family N-acetyltransferase n=1 Tax=Actinomyces qiguomingii TaxID=2057800 RepID=UPI000CA02F15|nr:GNAT family N-acetyltransferase [Actinomyces qiguomingii]
MVPADMEAISRLESQLFGAEGWSPAVLAAELDRTTGPGADRTYLVAHLAAPVDRGVSDSGLGAGALDALAQVGAGGSEAIVGYAGLWYGDGRGDADLLTIATVAAARRRGVATALLTALLGVAAQAGCRAVLLEVRASNEGAQRLYAAHGFTPIGRRRRYYLAPVEDAVVMRRSLSAT